MLQITAKTLAYFYGKTTWAFFFFTKGNRGCGSRTQKYACRFSTPVSVGSFDDGFFLHIYRVE